MATSDYYDEVQRVYIAYYGRPADSGGLDYWAGQLNSVAGNMNAIIDSFANSDEANSLYGSSTYEQRITNIYQQVLGRQPESDGAAWWLNQLQTGQKTLANLALDVLYGATGDDEMVVEHRLDAAQAFTEALAQGSFNYSGDDAAQYARDFLSDVMDDDTSLNSSLDLLQSVLDQIDTLSDDWDTSHGGGSGGDDGAELLPDDLAALSSLVSLDTETGALSVSTLRSEVINGANFTISGIPFHVDGTGADAYNAAFDVSNYEDAADGVLTPDELGVSQLGTLTNVTSETLESLFYGTLIKAFKAIDISELTEIQSFVVQNQSAILANNEAVISQYIDLLVSVFEDPAAQPVFDDTTIAYTAVVAGATFVELVGQGDDMALFDGLLAGFYPS